MMRIFMIHFVHWRELRGRNAKLGRILREKESTGESVMRNAWDARMRATPVSGANLNLSRARVFCNSG